MLYFHAKPPIGLWSRHSGARKSIPQHNATRAIASIVCSFLATSYWEHLGYTFVGRSTVVSAPCPPMRPPWCSGILGKGPGRSIGRSASCANIDPSPGETTLEGTKGATVRIIGTAHVSAKDAQHVRTVIATEQPDSVVVELDPQRLPRIGLTLDDLGGLAVVPPQPAPPVDSNFESWDPRGFLVSAFAQVSRGLLTQMYNQLTAQGMRAGGEFAAAIEEAQRLQARIVLADIDSIQTLEEFLTRVVQGNPFEFVWRYTTVMTDVLEDLVGTQDLTPELIDDLKVKISNDPRIFARLERDIPELYDSFIRLRDKHIAQAIQAEIESGARKVIVVVGLGHVKGVESNLMQQMPQWQKTRGSN